MTHGSGHLELCAISTRAACPVAAQRSYNPREYVCLGPWRMRWIRRVAVGVSGHSGHVSAIDGPDRTMIDRYPYGDALV